MNDIIPQALQASDYWKWIAAASVAFLLLVGIAIIKRARMRNVE